MSTAANLYQRRARVSGYVRSRQQGFDTAAWQGSVREFDDLDLSCSYEPNDQRILIFREEDEIRKALAQMGKHGPEDELNCGACGYDTCRLHALAIIRGLAENEMCLPYTIEQLRKAVDQVADSQDKLANTRAALMQAEKLANMGQLAAGIAHEVNNPLGVVILYAHLLFNEVQDPEIRKDLALIVEQADRCKKIVSGLLHFARQNKVVLQPVDLLGLVRHSLDAMHLPGRIHVDVRRACDDPVAEVDRDQIVQVLTNLVTNAVDAMPETGRLTVEVRGDKESVSLVVIDTGHGIPPDKRTKIFDPFFTTKQIGKGTGLGLAVTYGIVKMHRGDISVESNADPAAGPTGSTFTVRLPRRGEQE
jgi:signal transduction histidine kinase